MAASKPNQSWFRQDPTKYNKTQNLDSQILQIKHIKEPSCSQFKKKKGYKFIPYDENQ